MESKSNWSCLRNRKILMYKQKKKNNENDNDEAKKQVYKYSS